jgi:hypothetical protein
MLLCEVALGEMEEMQGSCSLGFRAPFCCFADVLLLLGAAISPSPSGTAQHIRPLTRLNPFVMSPHCRKQSNYYANAARKKAGKDSVKGLGRNAPDDAGAKEVPTGVKVPCGKVTDVKDYSRGLAYNEFIVYDTAQIKMRYAIKMKFNYA